MIDDFGEHIPGARKERAHARLEAAIAADPRCRNLARSWPAPDWKTLAEEHAAAGRSPGEIACVRALRDELRNREGKWFEQRMMANGAPAKGLRGLGLRILKGAIEVPAALDELETAAPRVWKSCSRRTLLYREIGHEHDLGRYTVHDLAKEGWYVYGSVPHGRVSAVGTTLREAARALGAKLGKAAGQSEAGPKPSRNPYQVRYQVRNNAREYSIWRQGPRGLVKVRECESVGEARHIVEKKRDELDRWWEEWRRVPESRRADNRPRTPPVNGCVSDPDGFERRFRFRGVQFGNWVEGDRRREELRNTSQGLDDLALVLGWEPGWLSLGRRLALAFGARGNGGPRRVRAHYESGQRVIAITKTTGAGTLAHEWFHALDNNAAFLLGTSVYGFASEVAPLPATTPAEVLAQSLQRYGSACRLSAMCSRARRLDERRPKSKVYWSTTRELAARAFEAWVKEELARRGITNDYLVNYRPADAWEGRSHLNQAYPYPFADELAELAPLVDAIAEAGREARSAWEKAAWRTAS